MFPGLLDKQCRIYYVRFYHVFNHKLNLSSHMSANRQKAIELAALANRIMGELAIHRHHSMIARGMKNWKTPALLAQGQSYWAIVEQHNTTMLAVTLCKVIELHKAYRTYMPEPHRSRMDAINSDLLRRQVPILRNKYCGHIWDKHTKQPISLSELANLVQKFINGRTIEEVENWYWCSTGNLIDGSIGGALEALRNELIAQHVISQSELDGHF